MAKTFVIFWAFCSSVSSITTQGDVTADSAPPQHESPPLTDIEGVALQSSISGLVEILRLNEMASIQEESFAEKVLEGLNTTTLNKDQSLFPKLEFGTPPVIQPDSASLLSTPMNETKSNLTGLSTFRRFNPDFVPSSNDDPPIFPDFHPSCPTCADFDPNNPPNIDPDAVYHGHPMGIHNYPNHKYPYRNIHPQPSHRYPFPSNRYPYPNNRYPYPSRTYPYPNHNRPGYRYPIPSVPARYPYPYHPSNRYSFPDNRNTHQKKVYPVPNENPAKRYPFHDGKLPHPHPIVRPVPKEPKPIQPFPNNKIPRNVYPVPNVNPNHANKMYPYPSGKTPSMPQYPYPLNYPNQQHRGSFLDGFLPHPRGMMPMQTRKVSPFSNMHFGQVPGVSQSKSIWPWDSFIPGGFAGPF